MQKKMSTYRFTEELDKLITEKAKKEGVSKNAVVQLELLKALKKDKKER